MNFAVSLVERVARWLVGLLQRVAARPTLNLLLGSFVTCFHEARTISGISELGRIFHVAVRNCCFITVENNSFPLSVWNASRAKRRLDVLKIDFVRIVQ